MRKQSGIKIHEIRVGEGSMAEKGKTVTIRYDGSLNKGDKFQEGTVCKFKIGKREVIAGLEYGVKGMQVGGRRRIVVSPHLAYGKKGVPGVIPQHAKLVFDVELLEVND